MGGSDGSAGVDWSRAKQMVLHVLLAGVHAGPSPCSSSGAHGGSAWAMASAHASQVLHARTADGGTLLGGGLLTIPDPADGCGSWADYVTHYEKVLVLGPPLTSGEGEFDMSPILFGLDDEVDWAASAGWGSGGSARVLAAVGLAHRAAHADHGHGGYGVLHPQIHGQTHGHGHGHGGEPGSAFSPQEPGSARGGGAAGGGGSAGAAGKGGKLNPAAAAAAGHGGWSWLKQLCEAGYNELPKPIDMASLFDRAGSLLPLPTGPLVLLCLNECAKFNALLEVVHADLVAMRAVTINLRDLFETHHTNETKQNNSPSPLAGCI
jgi:hypothetical protein